MGHRAAVSIGTNPQYGGTERRIEPYLIDFDGDLYGKRLVVEVWERLRDEAVFASEAELVAQIGRDVEATRGAVRPALLAGEEHTASYAAFTDLQIWAAPAIAKIPEGWNCGACVARGGRAYRELRRLSLFADPGCACDREDPRKPRTMPPTAPRG
jgi:hypothetical protein